MQKTKLPELHFELSAFEPVVSREAMEAHYFGHQGGYVKNFNSLMSEGSDDLEKIMFNYNGWRLHSLFWSILSPGNFDKASWSCDSKIIQDNYRPPVNGMFDIVEEIYTQCIGGMGSGWVVLHVDEEGYVRVTQIENHEIGGLRPICVIDFWEHLYYSDWLNNKRDFYKNFLKFIDWEQVELNYIEGGWK